MSWIQIVLEVPEADAESVAERLTELGALSVTFQDAADQPLYEPAPGQTPLWARLQVVGLFPAEADRDALRAALGAHADALTVQPLEDRDWVRAWMDDFRPMRFGERLWVCPGGFEPPEPSAVNLFLDPGLAFGSGSHATTALCLEWLDAHPPGGCTVLDYGCGSGILAVAAARLGASVVWAVDNDPQALVATRDNAGRNGVEALVHVCLPEDLPDLTADVVLANILAGPLVALAPDLAARVRAGGDLVLSGILNHQAQAVADAYRPWFDLGPPVTREDWVRLEGVRR